MEPAAPGFGLAKQFLGEYEFSAGGPPCGNIFGTVPLTEQGNGQLAMIRLLAQAPAQLDTIHARQMNIQQHQIGMQRCDLHLRNAPRACTRPFILKMTPFGSLPIPKNRLFDCEPDRAAFFLAGFQREDAVAGDLVARIGKGR